MCGRRRWVAPPFNHTGLAPAAGGEEIRWLEEAYELRSSSGATSFSSRRIASLRAQSPGRLKLTDGERRTLAQIGKQLERKALTEVGTIVPTRFWPGTGGWWRRNSMARRSGAIPAGPRSVEPLRSWSSVSRPTIATGGYDRIAGALANLGYEVSDQTVGNILKRQGIPTAPERKKTTTWKDFIRSHRDVLAATDFFTTEVWTPRGLVTYYILFIMHVATRRVHIAGLTRFPNELWMTQVARNLTMA